MYVVRDAQEIKPTFRTGVPVIPVPAGKQNGGTETMKTKTTLRTIDPNSKLRA